MSALADTGVLLAALFRGDRHHRWAVSLLTDARNVGAPLLVPDVVVGEAYTRVRYDKRVSQRRDASVALRVFDMVEAHPDLFQQVHLPSDMYADATRILRSYSDHAYSFVDALSFACVDSHPAIDRIATVDGADFRSYRFARPVDVVTPQDPPGGLRVMDAQPAETPLRSQSNVPVRA